MTMDRLFRVDLYPLDWLVDTSELEEGELAVFTQTVMLLYARRGDLDNDPQFIAQKIRSMSTRRCRILLESLFEKGFLFVNSAGKISQKRTENELKNKQNHLETSAKGGKKAAENRARNNENNDLNSTEDSTSLSTPSPSPNPSASATAKERSDQPPPITHKHNQVDYSILDLLDNDGLMDARVFASSGGHDLNSLVQAFNNAIQKGIMEKPRKPNKAFPAWIQKLSAKRH